MSDQLFILTNGCNREGHIRPEPGDIMAIDANGRKEGRPGVGGGMAGYWVGLGEVGGGGVKRGGKV